MTSSLDMIRGRSNVVTLTNNSGGGLVAGDVCVQDATADEKVTTTTSAASVLKIFVAAETIASGAAGRFYESGYCPLVNVNASVTRGRFLFTHTVAKQAAENATYGAGAFGKILKSGTTPSAIIYSATAQISGSGVARSGATTDGHLAVWDGSNADSIKDGGASGGGGAPTTTPYVTTAADAGLSAEIVIPGMSAHGDIAGSGGAGTSEEYDTATTGLTWDNAPNTVNSNTAILSHLYIKITTSNFYKGTKSWSPAGAFDARCKVMCGSEQVGQHQIALYIANSDDSSFYQLHLHNGNAYNVRAFDQAGTQIGSDLTWTANVAYLRIVRSGSNVWHFYSSTNGILWEWLGSKSTNFTVAKIGYMIYTADSDTYYFAVDWLRTSV